MSDIFDMSVAWLRAGGPHGYTLRQLAILATVMKSAEPPRVRELASALRLEKPIVSRAISVLEGAGLVERQRGRDRRECFVVPTPAAHVFRSVMGGEAHG